MELPPLDFESSASTSFTTPATSHFGQLSNFWHSMFSSYESIFPQVFTGNELNTKEEPKNGHLPKVSQVPERQYRISPSL